MSTIPDRCDDCGASYRKFRSGLTFDVVRIELRSELHRARVTRHTVLGRMHEHKIMQWGIAHGIGRCVPDPDATTQPATACQSDDDWFAEGNQTMQTPTEDASFDVQAMEAAPALAPTPAIERKARKPRAPRKAPKTVEPIVVTKIAEVFAAALESTTPIATAVAAPALALRFRHFWCSCGKRASAPIGAATSACTHRAAIAA